MGEQFYRMDYIYNRTPIAALYEQLAEEASELSAAALKLARIVRGENPTPMKKELAEANVVEEFTDLKVIADVIALHTDKEVYFDKLIRWHERVQEKEREEANGGENTALLDVATRPHGHWIECHEGINTEGSFDMRECSVCGRRSLMHRTGEPYCSQCGAKMDY